MSAGSVTGRIFYPTTVNLELDNYGRIEWKRKRY